MNGGRFHVQGQRISSFQGIKNSTTDHVIIDLRDNCLQSFEHFGTHPKLVELQLQNNRIDTFMGLTRQPRLAVINLKGNPIASHPWYRIMLLLTVGFSITIIDGVAVSQEERDMARAMGPDAALAVSYGWRLEPADRSPEEYHQIIDECKASRRRSVAHKEFLRTITHVLQECESDSVILSTKYSNSGIKCDYDALTVERLSVRVKQLEGLLSETKETLAAQQRKWREAVEVGCVEGLTGAELRCAESILFVDGIYLRTNVMTFDNHGCNEGVRVCLKMESSLLVFLSFMSRRRLVELFLDDIEVRHHRRNSLRIEGKYGAVFDISFEDSQILWSVYKLFYLRRGIPVPLLKLSDSKNVDATLIKDKRMVMVRDNFENSSNWSNHSVDNNMGSSKVSIPQIKNTSKTRKTSYGLDSFKFGTPYSESPPPVNKNKRTDEQQELPQEENISQEKISDTMAIEFPSSSIPTNDADVKVLDVGVGFSKITASSLCNVEPTDGNHESSVSSCRRMSSSQQRTQPPSRVPRRRCSSVSVPVVPRRLSSRIETPTTPRDLDTIGTSTQSPPNPTRFDIARFRIADSDSDSDSAS
ncbi:uncharacterized protein TM35_000341180 [Trypanosoma theileri]|uniref:Leucine-rich repeat protein (LRRP) n=1 Tax=Trypanosoma theileri TaxID=67003 RepID=A0A1X0NLC1_9TRYP|nr:uncharacterized protein TM35_000341180 [Trypanosoma theileri]ORC85506.1 hypothetical protein TM35_000341180 [Trypanosoma theileri]